ncbi:MAG TPA: serine hydrolase domain-containing protein [Nevskiaceae bacterium]|nr:serine hydrolase domain-containing protein [Nevskiaceae bacterium]
METPKPPTSRENKSYPERGRLPRRAKAAAILALSAVALSGCAPVANTQESSASSCKSTLWQKDNLQQLRQATRAVMKSKVVKAGVAPGGAVAVGCGSKELVHLGVGRTGNGNAVSADNTVYDISSVSKMFTATAIFMLQNEGRLGLDDPVGRFLPTYRAGSRSHVTFRMLMQHRSGLVDPRYSRLLAGADTPGQAWQKVLTYPLAHRPGTEFSYSNAGFSALWAAGGRAAKEPLQDYLQQQLFRPLGMNRTGYQPAGPCAPTSPDENQSRTLECVPQDRLARALGGEAGHAGVFSTVTDLGRFASMLASGGKKGGHSYLTTGEVRLMGAHQSDSAYGTGAWTNQHKAYSRQMSPDAFGHYGYNGVSLFVDPDTNKWAVLATNGTLHQEVPDAQAHVAVRAVNDTFVRSS